MYRTYPKVDVMCQYTLKNNTWNACYPATKKENIVSNLEAQYMFLSGHICLPTTPFLTSLLQATMTQNFVLIIAFIFFEIQLHVCITLNNILHWFPYFRTFYKWNQTIFVMLLVDS